MQAFLVVEPHVSRARVLGADRLDPEKGLAISYGLTYQMSYKSSPDSMLQTLAQVPKRNLVAEVAAQIEQAILNGQFPPDHPLPPEARLSASLGVSRTVTREAMRSLAAKGLVQISQGRPAQVLKPDSGILVDGMLSLLRRTEHAPAQLFEARRVLEVESAGLAAQRATSAEIAALERLFREQNKSVATEQIVAREIEFHECVARAAHNPVLLMLQQCLSRPMAECLTEAVRRLPRDTKTGNHRPIVKAIKARDPAAARRAMESHLRIVEMKLRAVDLWDASAPTPQSLA